MEIEKATNQNSRKGKKGFSLKAPALYEPHARSISPQCLMVMVQKKRHAVPFESIFMLQADGAYTHILCSERKHYLTCKKLGDYENIVCPWGFSRIHRSYIVNMHHIIQVEDNTRYCTITLRNDKEVKVAYKYRTEFLQRWWGFCLAIGRRDH